MLADEPVEAPPSPNVIVIVSDDAGYADFGAYGGTQFPTPHFDRLAERGVRFTQGYVAASVCHPSRAGLLTGRYPHRFGQEFNGPTSPLPGYTPDQMGLDVDEHTIGDVFRAVGYRTIEIGKWHMGGQPQFNPLRRGFDECFLIQSGNRSYFPYDKPPKDSKRIFRNTVPVPEHEIAYVTDALTDAAVEFIERRSGQPFFMYLSYTAVHTPMQGKPEDLEHFRHIQDKRRRTYAAMFKAMDEGLGRVQGALEAHGISDDTLIVFINDNGGPSGNGSSNAPFRGVKGTHLEGGNRVAYTMTWPAGIEGGRTFDDPVSALDILPTTIAAAGGAPTSDRPIDGVNLLPYLTGQAEGRPHETLYWRRGPGAAIRDGDWKLLRVDTLPAMLFDLASDPTENLNLAERHPEVVERLSAKLEAWEATLAPPKWTTGERWAQKQIDKHRDATRDVVTLSAEPE